MGKVELMQEKIANQRQLPNEIKNRLNTVTFVNLLISIALMVYMIVVNLLYMNETIEVFTNNTKASAFTFAIIDIIIFEIAYRRESHSLAVHAIEFLCVCLYVLAIPYIYIYSDPVFRNIMMISPVYLSIYYVGKTIVLHIIEKNKYISNLSDVLQILQDDSENTSYLDDDEGPDINVDVVPAVQELEEKKAQEKQIIKKAKRDVNKKENNDD